MPITENADPAAGRVTRSLRKRLTSIDSDVSSRPGTPVNNNLTTIPETGTPSKRLTRRASISTPINTPSKTTTPARRATRRRSVNVQEEDQTILTKTIDVLKEEEIPNKTPKDPNRRVTRSTSKSPQEIAKSAKESVKKASKKSPTVEEPEIINLDDSIEIVALKTSPNSSLSGKTKTRISIKKEKHIDDIVLEKFNTSNDSVKNDKQIENESTPSKKTSKVATPEKLSNKKNATTDVSSSPKPKSGKSTAKSPSKVKKSKETTISEKLQSAPESSPKKMSSGRKNKEAVKSSPGPQKLQKSTDKNKPELGNVEESSTKPDSSPSSKRRISFLSLTKSSPKVVKNVEPEQKSPSPVKQQLAKSSPQKKHRLENLKNVGFNDTADENTIKTVYPKTPGLTKSKSYILDSSKDVEQEDSLKPLADKHGPIEDEKIPEEDEKIPEEGEKIPEEDENDGITTKTPFKLKLKSVESSTPILNASTKQNKTSEIQEQHEDLSATENEKPNDEEFVFPKSWSQSVSGKAGDSAKIDLIALENIEGEEKEVESKSKNESSKISNNSKASHKRISDDSEDEDDMLEEFDEEELDGEEEEEQNAEKTVFLDDEAMEVAEGEESMDSEEREYLEQNEVPVYAESLGSEDSEEDDGDDEEPDEEDAAFIVSDTEEDEMGSKPNGNKYRRIIKNDESSDGEEKTPNNETGDFCLFVDSSAEEDDEILPAKLSKKKVKSGDESADAKFKLNKESPRKSHTKKTSNVETSFDEEDFPISQLRVHKSQQNNLKMQMKAEENKTQSSAKSETETSSSNVVSETQSVEIAVAKKEKPEFTQRNKDKNNQISGENMESNLLPKSPLKPRKSVEDHRPPTKGAGESDSDDLQEEPENNSPVKSPMKSKKTLSRSKLGISDDASDNDDLQEESENDSSVKSPMTSRKSLKKIVPAMSEVDREQEIQKHNDNAEVGNPKTNPSSKSPMKSRNSMNKSKSTMLDDDSDDLQEERESYAFVKSPMKSRKSLNKSKDDVKELESQEKDNVEKEELKTLEVLKSRKSSNKTKPGMPDDKEKEETDDDNHDVHEEFPEIVSSAKSPRKSKKSLNKFEPAVPEEKELIENDDRNVHKEEPDANVKSPKKSRKSLKKSQIAASENDDLEEPETNLYTTSSPRKSQHFEAQNELEKKESLLSSYVKSPKKSRKSLNKSKATISQDDEDKDIQFCDYSSEEEKRNLRSPAKSPKKSRKSSDISSSITDDGLEEYLQKEKETESPARKNRKSSNKSTVEISHSEYNLTSVEDKNIEDDDQKNTFRPLRKSLNKSSTVLTEKQISIGDQSENDENLEEIQQNSTTPKTKPSQKFLNESKNEKQKSFVRTSTEESNINDEKPNKLKETVSSSEDDGSEPEETLSATEITTENSIEKTLNISKKLRKSLNRSNLPMKEQNQQQNVIGSSENENGDGVCSLEVTDNEEESSGNVSEDAQFSDPEIMDRENTIEEHNVSPSKQNINSSHQKPGNDSKLDETFQMDPKYTLSSSLHDSLHRSILRKSINTSSLPGTTKYTNTKEPSDDSSSEEEVNVNKKFVSERGLSVSLSSIQIKKKKIKDEKAVRNSFTIGVSVRKNGASDESSSECTDLEHPEIESPLQEDSSENDVAQSSNEDKPSSLSYDEDLAKVEEIQEIGPYKPRKSLPHSVTMAPPTSHIKQDKKIKRTSLYLQDQAASNSFVEKISEESSKIKRKRLSISLSSAVPSSVNEETNQATEQKLEKCENKSDKKKKDVKHILDRCDLIIEAANQAKREAKMTAKKSKVKKPKWMDKNDKEQKREEELKIPLVSKKEFKRKEKLKKDLAKAVKHSTALLNKIVEPTKKPLQETIPEKYESTNPTKRLEAEFLESLVQLSQPKKKKTPQQIETTPPSDKENSNKKAKKGKNIFTDISDVKSKAGPRIETLETACGTITVEPATPKKLRYQNGFRESPKTPIGFKVQDLTSSNQNTKSSKSRKAVRKLITASGAFVEEDLPLSNSKMSAKKDKVLKRKRPQIEEPVYTLPKTQWTSSGVFVEEDLQSPRPLANSTATQFLVASLNDVKKNKNFTKVVSSTSLNNALSFKQNALFHDKVPRQEVRGLLYRKQRKLANNHF